MRPLSNFLRKTGIPGQAGNFSKGDPILCRPARREELHPALRLVLGTGGRLADDAHVADFIEFSSQRGLDPAATWVAERRGRLLWAVLPVASPGKTMLVLAPSILPRGGDVPAAGQLIEAACSHHAARGVRLAQALLDPADAAVRELHLVHSFRVMAELIYLQTILRRPVAPPPLPPGLGWVTYSPESHPLFAATIAATYEASLDCPGLNGVRDIEDVVAGHKASGEFDPDLWLLLCGRWENDPAPAPLGVLLLSRMPRNDAVELVYLGLPPAARGKGWGDLLMRQALAATSAAGRARLTLAVDSGNAPAMQLYFRHGLHRVAAKTAMMRELEERVECRG